jgi:hypothetical protein
VTISRRGSARSLFSTHSSSPLKSSPSPFAETSSSSSGGPAGPALRAAKRRNQKQPLERSVEIENQDQKDRTGNGQRIDTKGNDHGCVSVSRKEPAKLATMMHSQNTRTPRNGNRDLFALVFGSVLLAMYVLKIPSFFESTPRYSCRADAGSRHCCSPTTSRCS